MPAKIAIASRPSHDVATGIVATGFPVQIASETIATLSAVT